MYCILSILHLKNKLNWTELERLGFTLAQQNRADLFFLNIYPLQNS